MSVAGEIQGVGVIAVVGAVVQLLAIGGVAWRAGAWTSRVDTERRLEREATDKALAEMKDSTAEAFADMKNSTSAAFGEIKATLGNGAPGTVVRTNVCEALHAGVQGNLALVREDIRSLHDAVNQLHQKP